MLFFGLLQHCAMPNRSDKSRTGLILQYLPKYVRPMEDLKVMKQISQQFPQNYTYFFCKKIPMVFYFFGLLHIYFYRKTYRNCFSK